MKGRAWLRLTSAASTRSPCRTSRRGSRAAAFRATASPLRQHLRRWRREQRRCPTGTTPTQCLRGEGGNRAACFVCTRARAHTHRVYPQFGNLSGLTVIHWGGLRVDRAQFDMRAIQNDTWVRCATQRASLCHRLPQLRGRNRRTRRWRAVRVLVGQRSLHRWRERRCEQPMVPLAHDVGPRDVDALVLCEWNAGTCAGAAHGWGVRMPRPIGGCAHC